MPILHDLRWRIEAVFDLWNLKYHNISTVPAEIVQTMETGMISHAYLEDVEERDRPSRTDHY